MANLIDSTKKKLSVDEIATIAAENNEAQIHPSAIIEGLKAEMSQPKSLPLRFGNTLFLCHLGKNRSGVCKILNADTASNMISNGEKWASTLYKVGFDFILCEFKDSSMLHLFKALVSYPQRKGMAYQVIEKQSGRKIVVFSLGPKRELAEVSDGY